MTGHRSGRDEGGAVSTAPAFAPGYLHEVGFYGSDEEFRDLICPFALGGIEAGEPVVFAYDPYKVELLRAWLPDSPHITYITDAGPYATPSRAIVAWRKVVERHLASHAPRVRIAGNVPHPGYGQPYVGWDRYEAAIDRALGDLPVWAPCLYDTRIAPAEVLDTAARLHHDVLDRSGAHVTNATFHEARHLAEFLSPDPDPLERSAPTVELVDPTPAQARAAVAQLTHGVLDVDRHRALVLAVSEAATNAVVHGRPPLSVRIWLGDARVITHVHDSGSGPTDPLVGLLHGGGDGAESGRGLWLTHQLDIDVALLAGSDGFTVRLCAEREGSAA
jgi:anti-sigma regulatory factor (Ser/Thr protein kinase)